MPAVQEIAYNIGFTPYAPIEQYLSTSCSCSCTQMRVCQAVLVSHAGDEQDDSIFPMLPVPALCNTFSLEASMHVHKLLPMQDCHARCQSSTDFGVAIQDIRLGDDDTEDSGRATYDSGPTLPARLRRQ